MNSSLTQAFITRGATGKRDRVPECGAPAPLCCGPNVALPFDPHWENRYSRGKRWGASALQDAAANKEPTRETTGSLTGSDTGITSEPISKRRNT